MDSKPKLFCFTYAGGTSDFFNIIETELETIEVVKLDYAGHGIRHKEKYYKDFDELADDLMEKMESKLEGNYSLFGYSMGSITVIEILKRIIKSNFPLPKNVFLAAHEPHTKSELIGFKSDELDEWVKQRTLEFGEVPERLLNNKVFWRTYLPLYRSDYTIIGKYKFEELNLKTTIPATVFYSEKDTPLTEMKLWKNYFIGNCDFYGYEGNHFFIKQHHAEMAEVIKEKMKKIGEQVYDIR